MFTRYAVYLTAEGAFADAGASWLGWDMRTGQEVDHPVIPGLDSAALTERPRKYGFHGTIKAPFALAAGTDDAALRQAFHAACADLSAVLLEGLSVTALGRFLALTPVGDQTALRALASEVVAGLDGFRAPSSDAALTKRRKANLSPAQDAMLLRWGYPYVMEEFRFHMTLTGPVSRGAVETVQAQVAAHFAPVLPAPFEVSSLTLVGEQMDGRFIEIMRVPLGRSAS